jgi:hypothetical protein
MSDAEENKSWHRYRDAMTESTKLTQQGQNEEALRLLDDWIAMAMSENENRWVLTLSHHAAVISNFLRNFSREKHYYRTEVRVCPSGKSVDPKFLSSNGVLAHSRIAEEYASIRELIASVNTSAFVVTIVSVMIP